MLSRLRRTARNLFRKNVVEQELSDEVGAYLEMLADEKMAAGSKARDARRWARAEFGGIDQVKERVREVRMGAALEQLGQDLRYAVRMLRHNPGFAAVAIFTLALGVGANTAIFSVANGVLLRPLPYSHPERLVWFWDYQSPQASETPLSCAEFLAFRERNRSLEAVVATRALNFTHTGMGTPERVRADIVSAEYFAMLGVTPSLGRNFSDAEGQPGASRVALLTHGYWSRRFGGDSGVIGKNITLDGAVVTVVGVLPASYTPMPEVDLFLNPIYGVPELLASLGDPRKMVGPHYLAVIGKLKPGVTIEQAQSDLQSIAQHLELSAVSSTLHSPYLIHYSDRVIGDLRPTLYALLGLVAFVLLIACANVANLLLARASTREREMAVRASLGASPARLARQMIAEGILLSLIGGIAGVALAFAGVRALVAAHPQGLPRLDSIYIDGRVLLFALAASLATGILFGLAPAIRSMRAAPAEALKQAGRAASGAISKNWLQRALVIGEVALSLILLTGAGLLTRSFVRLLGMHPGFRTGHLLTFSVAFNGPRYSGQGAGQRIVGFLDAVHRMEALPGVEAVAGSNDLPLQGEDTTSYAVAEGSTAPATSERTLAGMHTVTPGYFRSLGIPLLRGREFSNLDTFGKPLVIVINQALAEHLWPGQTALGKRLRLFQGPGGAPAEIVGVAGNVKHNGLNAPDSFDAYAPFAQQPWSYVSIAVRNSGSTEALVPLLRSTINEHDPSLAMYAVSNFDEIIAESLGPRRVTLALVGLFAALALILAAIGIYGVMSYVVASRTQEIGVRIALGASRGNVIWMVAGRGMALACAGLAIGLAGAFALTRFLRSLLFEVKPTDALTFAAVSVLLALVSLVACYLPARRATRIDPMAALRCE